MALFVANKAFLSVFASAPVMPFCSAVRAYLFAMFCKAVSKYIYLCAVYAPIKRCILIMCVLLTMSIL